MVQHPQHTKSSSYFFRVGLFKIIDQQTDSSSVVLVVVLVGSIVHSSKNKKLLFIEIKYSKKTKENKQAKESKKAGNTNKLSLTTSIFILVSNILSKLLTANLIFKFSFSRFVSTRIFLQITIRSFILV